MRKFLAILVLAALAALAFCGLSVIVAAFFDVSLSVAGITLAKVLGGFAACWATAIALSLAWSWAFEQLWGDAE